MFKHFKFTMLTGTSAILGIYMFCKNEIYMHIQQAAIAPYFIGGFIGCIVTALLFRVYIKRLEKKYWELRSRYCRTDYEILKAEYVYMFDNNDHRKQQQNIIIKIKALNDGVAKYYAKYAWTGKGTQSAPKLLTNSQKIENLHPGDPWTTYEVHFQELKKGEELKIELEFEFYDAGDSFRPVFYRNISQEIGDLSMRLIFSKKRLPKPYSIKKEIIDFISPNPQQDMRGLLRIDPFTNEIVWDNPKPTLNTIYKISWEWPDNETEK